MLIHKENGGVSTARNQGILSSIGEYIIFLDADDILIEESLQAVWSTLSCNIDMAICSSYVEMAEDGTRKLNKMFSEDTLKRNRSLYDTRCLCQNLSSMCIAIYRRKFLLDNHLMVKDGITCGEDTDFYFRCLLASKSVALIDCALFAYRYNPTSVSNNLNYRRILDVLSISAERMYELIESPTDALDNMQTLNFFATKFIHFAIQISKLHEQNRKICYQVIDENKTLLKYAKGKEEKLFTWICHNLGSKFAVRLFGIAVSMRNKFIK